MNAFEILGSLIQNGMGASAGRLGHTIGNEGFGGAGGMPGAGAGGRFGGSGPMPAGGDAGSVFDILGKVVGPMLGGGGAGAAAPAAGRGFPGAGGMPGGGGFPGGAGFPGGLGSGPAAAILKQVAGSILGGSAGSGANATGAGAMAILAGLAAKALGAPRQQGGGMVRAAPAQPEGGDDLAAVLSGLRRASNVQEETLVQDVATLTVRAMLNAAKADGRIDQNEAQRLVGKLQEDGVTAEEERFLREEIRKPMETDAIVRAVRSPQVAAQVYAASVLAIEADTEVEKRYLEDLAAKLGLQQQVVAYIHHSLGVA